MKLPKLNISPQALVAVILAISVGTCLVALTAAAMWDALFDHEKSGLSQEYESLLTGTLGVAVGALAGYIGGRGEGTTNATTTTPAGETAPDEDTNTETDQGD